MNRLLSLLIALLIGSVGLNAYLLLRPGAAPSSPPPISPEPDAGPQGTEASVDVEKRSDRDTLERALQAAQARVTILDSIDPVTVAIHSSTPLDEKLAVLAPLEKTERQNAIDQLAARIAAEPDLESELLRLLEVTRDRPSLELIAELLMHPALTTLTARHLETFFDLAGSGDLPERRRAAMRPLYRHGIGLDRQGEFRQRFAAILQDESDPEVLALGLQHFDWWGGGAPPPSYSWLQGLVSRADDEHVRRRAAIAYARGPIPEREIYDLIDSAPSERERAAWTDALSRVLNAGSAAKNLRDPARFFRVIQGEPRLKTRQHLLRGMLFRTPRAEWGGFLHDFSTHEPDAEQRARLRQLEQLIEAGQLKGARELDALIYGRAS